MISFRKIEIKKGSVSHSCTFNILLLFNCKINLIILIGYRCKVERRMSRIETLFSIVSYRSLRGSCRSPIKIEKKRRVLRIRFDAATMRNLNWYWILGYCLPTPSITGRTTPDIFEFWRLFPAGTKHITRCSTIGTLHSIRGDTSLRVTRASWREVEGETPLPNYIFR